MARGPLFSAPIPSPQETFQRVRASSRQQETGRRQGTVESVRAFTGPQGQKPQFTNEQIRLGRDIVQNDPARQIRESRFGRGVERVGGVLNRGLQRAVTGQPIPEPEAERDPMLTVRRNLMQATSRVQSAIQPYIEAHSEGQEAQAQQVRDMLTTLEGSIKAFHKRIKGTKKEKK